MNKIVDLRSDTVTQPTPGMRHAMMNAPLGDDVFGDDPSVNALQEKIADLLGFEEALFMLREWHGDLLARDGTSVPSVDSHLRIGPECP